MCSSKLLKKLFENIFGDWLFTRDSNGILKKNGYSKTKEFGNYTANDVSIFYLKI